MVRHIRFPATTRLFETSTAAGSVPNMRAWWNEAASTPITQMEPQFEKLC